MGQQHSSEKPEKPSRSSTLSDHQKKVNRRQSIQALPIQGRSSPANPSASATNAVAETSNPRHIETPQLEQYLQGSPDTSRIGRSGSRRSKKDDTTANIKSSAQEPIPIAASPMNVPAARSKPVDFDEKEFEKDFVDGDGDYDDRRYVPPSQLRPPRLPLPIADAILSLPESPSLDPIDKGVADVPVMEASAGISGDSALRRKSSMVSLATDEDDMGDELPPVDPNQPTVPTVINWNHPAHKVFITGTFANWEKKFKMHHKKDGSGHLSAVLHLPPGTHHLLFLADEKMTTNPDIPTAVDFNNVLVNYIEIATEDVVTARRQSAQPIPEKRDSTQAVRHEALHEEGESGADSGDDFQEEIEPLAEEIAPGDFRRIIPRALLDMEWPDEDPRYMQASQIIQDCPAPPALPMFLSKSILNGVTQVKDDTSVLVLPNHTVLNHLMTSSVKNGVLATSVTTRYKKKYVTTISFKPVPSAKPLPSEQVHD